MLTIYIGAEPARQQEIRIPEDGLLFIDATVSQAGVVDVSVKDVSARLALPGQGGPEDGAP